MALKVNVEQWPLCGVVFEFRLNMRHVCGVPVEDVQNLRIRRLKINWKRNDRRRAKQSVKYEAS